MEQKINRKGALRQQWLFMAVYFPTAMLLKESWLIWLALEPLGIFITCIFAQRYPDLLIYKKYYWITQFVGFLFGVLIWLIPEYGTLLMLIWIFGTIPTLWHKWQNIARTLSGNKIDKAV
jgi:hypothetical protein